MSEIKYYPLTHPQKGIWNIEKVYQNTSIGNVAGTLRIKGNVDFNLLEKAINKFIEKNDGIRLRIVEDDNQPKQYVSEYKYTKIDFVDFSSLGIDTMYKWDEEQTKIPFEFIDSDLFYFAMIKLSDSDGGFYAKTHHIISDAWSMSIIGNQVIDYYSAFKAELEINEDIPSYIDYINSELEYKSSDRFQKDKEYWNDKFSDAFEPTTLKNRDSKDFNTVSKRKTLLTPVKFTNKLREYCAQNKTSPYTLFLCALSMYINRVSNKENIIIGTPLLNRSNSKEKSMFGMFINPVPLRVNVNGHMDFKTFSETMLKESISALKHQKYPYDLLLKEVRNQGISDNFYEIVLSYQNSKFNKQEHTEEYITRWHFNGHQIKPLIININDREDEGRLIIDYDFREDLFYVKEIEFIHSHIISLLWHALDNPIKSISKLEMITEQEKHKILHQFNDKDDHYLNNRKLDNVLKLNPDEIEENTRCYILDKNLNIMPIGIAGELYISGNNTPNIINVNKAILSPFNEGEKIYNTGIIARWYPNGEIKYIGNTNDKVELVNDKKVKQKEKINIRIASTFTSEPIKEYIEWWGNKFGYIFNVQFSSYNQVFQELLNPESMLSTNTHGFNVLLIRFEDFIRQNTDIDNIKITKLEQVFEELKAAINKFSSEVPLVIPIFPISTHIYLSDLIYNKVKELNLKFNEFLSNKKNIYTTDLNKIENLYNIESIFDSIKDKEGHLPFTDEYYAVMATQIARKIITVRKQIFKVIVLDCDNTLWDGVCGEVGTLGIKIEDGHKKLQEFMVRKYEEGMLLAICSKNNEKDVFDVFDKNPNMILQRKHIVSWKVNWEEKSKNIREIAEHLNLGLDSFIFIDDSPIECSKMIENCPEVLTLQLPSDERYFPLFLNHIWAFDRVNITKEDTLRSAMYEAEQKRKEVVDTGVTLDDFLKKLELRVSMREICESEIERAAQLTQRTNQFNLSTIRRTEKEIIDIMHDDKSKCYVVEAADKYGDYGIVGLVILKHNEGKLLIDTLLLSCRILGRNVENVILAGIRRYAEENGIDNIETVFIPTDKNKPALDFLEKTKFIVVEKTQTRSKYKASAKDLPRVIAYISFFFNECYKNPDNYKNNSLIFNRQGNIRNINGEVDKIVIANGELCNTSILEKNIYEKYILPLKYFTGKRLLNIMTPSVIKNYKFDYIAPRNMIEKKLVSIWEDILQCKGIGVNNNFFELGGDSLTAVQLLSSLNSHNMQIGIQDLYKHPTIKELSNYVKVCDIETDDSSKLSQNVAYDYANIKHTELQTVPITDSILFGDLPPVDSVALSYIPDEFVAILGQSRVKNILESFDNKPILYNYMTTKFGNIGAIILPILGKDIYNNKELLISLSARAITLAEKLGAKVVSLTGLIPSATNYGLDIIENCKVTSQKIQVTTGHATTAASVILSIIRLLNESERLISEERICVLGLGSIGTTSIKLLLSVLPNPYSITLCDIYEKRDYLEELKRNLQEEYGFDKDITIVYSKEMRLPDEVYKSTLIIGATNVPDILDVNKLNPGTLIIDDSAPHCFSKEQAINRLKKYNDVLFTEGGTLESPSPIDKKVYLPAFINPNIMGRFYQHFFMNDEITGCILSSLITVKYKYLKPVFGSVSIEDCVSNFLKLEDLGFKGARLHCDDFVLPRENIEIFKHTFGNKKNVI